MIKTVFLLCALIPSSGSYGFTTVSTKLSANVTTTAAPDCYDSGEPPPTSTTEDIIAGTILLTTASISFLINGGASLTAHRLSSMSGSFTMLSISQAVADCGVLAIYTVWSAPLIYSQSSIGMSAIGFKVGHLSLFFWYGSLYGMLFVAVNRFVAIMRPMSYQRIFSNFNTGVMIAVGWVIATFHTLLFFYPGCGYYFDAVWYLWAYDLCTECGTWITLFDLYYGAAFFVVTFTINMSTLLGLRQLKARVSGMNLTAAEKKRRSRRELLFFIQACVNGAVFELMILSFNIFSTWYEGKWYWFVTTTIMWEACHSTNGWLFFLFNPEVRRGMWRFVTTRGKEIEASRVVSTGAAGLASKTKSNNTHKASVQPQ